MKKVAVLGASLGYIGTAALMAAAASTGRQVELVQPGYASFNKGRAPLRKEKATQSRIKKQWYTVDSPEVKRMSKKIEPCVSCGTGVYVPSDYKEEYCCSGSMQSMCGCGGFPINAVFCRKCESKHFGKK